MGSGAAPVLACLIVDRFQNGMALDSCLCLSVTALACRLCRTHLGLEVLQGHDGSAVPHVQVHLHI